MSKRRSGWLNDLLNVIFFLVAIASVLALLAVLDPSVKHWFSKILP